MQATSKWKATVAVAAAAFVALLAVASIGSSPSAGVNAQTEPTPCVTPDSTVTPVAFNIIASASPNPAQTDEPVTFTAIPTCGSDVSGVSYIWQFDDGSSAAGNPVQKLFSVPGVHTATVQAVGSGGRTGSAVVQVVVIAALNASISGPSTGNVGERLTFTATVTPPSGQTNPSDLVYTWDFGDGSTATGQTVTHIYNTTSMYTITLVTSSVSAGTVDNPRTGIATKEVTIGDQVPSINLTISGPQQATAGRPVSFKVNATGVVPSDVVYTWDFGDNTATQTGPTVDHTFTNAGFFKVTVTASSVSVQGLTGTATMNITITAPTPTPSPSPSPTPTGPTASYLSGWNQVAGPAGMTFPQCNGPLYTFQAGDTDYEVLQNSSGVGSGQGYWCYFNAPTTIALTGSGTTSATIVAPPSQWVMVGNPSANTNVTVKGADSVVTYDQASNRYLPVTVLTPGKGAWAISLDGGTLTVSP